MATSEAKAAIVIRDITRISELHAVEELQREIWGVADLEVFPALALIPMREVGAVLIGAFEGEQMIGFVFGFPGSDKGQLILHSDMLAVRPKYRGQGLGYKLKLAQRERAIAAGIETITWTFDPLQSLNAHLNINRLGVIADSYRVNYYGETTSFLHRTGTDRLWARWSLNSERVKGRVEGDRQPGQLSAESAALLVQVAEGNEPLMLEARADASTIVIEIPGEINTILSRNPELAGRWREATRQAFRIALARDFRVEEFYVRKAEAASIGSYLLRRNPVSALDQGDKH